MGGTCGVSERTEKCLQRVENLEGRDYCEVQDIDGKILLNKV
jgi:hypothetical protein